MRTTDRKHQVVIPAMDIETFGFVTPQLTAKVFHEHGHFPSIVKISDLLLSTYVNRHRRSKTMSLNNQKNRRGAKPTGNMTISVAPRFTVGPVCYDTPGDSRRFDDLYDDLVKSLMFSIESLDHIIKDEALAKARNRLAEKTAFRIAKIRTVSLKTQQSCDWQPGKYDVVSPSGENKREIRMGLVAVNGIMAETLPKDVLIEAADGLFTDQCVLGFTEESMCTSIADTKNAQRASGCKSIW